MVLQKAQASYTIPLGKPQGVLISTTKIIIHCGTGGLTSRRATGAVYGSFDIFFVTFIHRCTARFASLRQG